MNFLIMRKKNNNLCPAIIYWKKLFLIKKKITPKNWKNLLICDIEKSIDFVDNLI